MAWSFSFTLLDRDLRIFLGTGAKTATAKILDPPSCDSKSDVLSVGVVRLSSLARVIFSQWVTSVRSKIALGASYCLSISIFNFFVWWWILFSCSVVWEGCIFMAWSFVQFWRLGCAKCFWGIKWKLRRQRYWIPQFSDLKSDALSVCLVCLVSVLH